MGSIDKSYGIHVASLAQLPKEVIERANEILEMYETKNKKEKPYKQIELFTENEETNDNKDFIIEKINKINPLEITPIQAINILYELKQQLNKN